MVPARVFVPFLLAFLASPNAVAGANSIADSYACSIDSLQAFLDEYQFQVEQLYVNIASFGQMTASFLLNTALAQQPGPLPTPPPLASCNDRSGQLWDPDPHRMMEIVVVNVTQNQQPLIAASAWARIANFLSPLPALFPSLLAANPGAVAAYFALTNATNSLYYYYPSGICYRSFSLNCTFFRPIVVLGATQREHQRCLRSN